MNISELESIECPQCGDEFSVWAIKVRGEDPYEADDGTPLCSANCMVEYLQEQRRSAPWSG